MTMKNEQLEELNKMYKALDEKTDAVADRMIDTLKAIKASINEEITEAHVNVLSEQTIFQSYAVLNMVVIEMLKDDELPENSFDGLVVMLDLLHGMLKEQAKDVFIAETTANLTDSGVLDTLLSELDE